MAIKEKDEKIEEHVSTHSQRSQMIVFILIFVVILFLGVSSYLRYENKTDLLGQKESARSVDGISPHDSQNQFDLDYQRALARNNKSNDVKESPVIEQLKQERENLLNKNSVDTTLASVENVDTWKEDELARVRESRYDDYTLDLGAKSSTKQTASRSSYTANTGKSYATSLSKDPKVLASAQQKIAEVNKKMQEAMKMREQMLQAGTQALAPVGTLSQSGRVQRTEIVGQSRSISDQKQPEHGQRLLPVTTVVRAVLDQEMISDYQGPFRARIIEDVYDVTHRYVLIPAGSTIDGNSKIVRNVNEPIQARMGLSINWAVLPNGHKIDFSKQYVEDRAGVSAVKDKVNRHLFAQILGVAAYAILSSESSRGGSGSNNDSTFAGDVGQSSREQFAPLAQKYLNLVPTITLRAGTPLRIYISEEIYIHPWSEVGSEYVRY